MSSAQTPALTAESGDLTATVEIVITIDDGGIASHGQAKLLLSPTREHRLFIIGRIPPPT